MKANDLRAALSTAMKEMRRLGTRDSGHAALEQLWDALGSPGLTCPMCFVRLADDGRCDCCGNKWGYAIGDEHLTIVEEAE